MLRKFLAKVGGQGFGNCEFSLPLLIRFFIVQKVFRINGKIPWPVHWTSKVTAAENINCGSRNPGMSMGCHIDGRNGIVFGKNVWVGPRVSIISMNHDVNNYHEYIEGGPVEIGDNCWLGANATVLPGVKLGGHTVVAAGSVVTRSFPEENQVLAGVPAVRVKRLDEYRGQ